jgi:hypothetical protein
MSSPATDRAKDRVAALKMGFRFTDRQARFLLTVLQHSGVFMGRHYAAFAGITHGQKVHDFLERLLAARFATACHVGRTGRTRIFHVHHKPLYAAIGEPENRNRKPVAIGRAIERMMLLDAVLAEREVLWLATERDKYAHFVCLFRSALQNDELPRLVFRKDEQEQTVRYFPDKLPIGVDPETQRHLSCSSRPTGRRWTSGSSCCGTPSCSGLLVPGRFAWSCRASGRTSATLTRPPCTTSSPVRCRCPTGTICARVSSAGVPDDRLAGSAWTRLRLASACRAHRH